MFLKYYVLRKHFPVRVQTNRLFSQEQGIFEQTTDLM